MEVGKGITWYTDGRVERQKQDGSGIVLYERKSRANPPTKFGVGGFARDFRSYKTGHLLFPIVFPLHHH